MCIFIIILRTLANKLFFRRPGLKVVVFSVNLQNVNPNKKCLHKFNHWPSWDNENLKNGLYC